MCGCLAPLNILLSVRSQGGYLRRHVADGPRERGGNRKRELGKRIKCDIVKYWLPYSWMYHEWFRRETRE